MQTFRTLILSLCVLSFTGCGLIDYVYLPPAEDTVQEVFEAGTDAMREKNYYQASQYFQKIKDNYPYSSYAVRAELALGDALYLNKRYAESAEAYMDFESLHPRNESMPYVLYQIGMSLQNTFISVDRPVTGIKEAIGYFERLIQIYPNTEYAQSAPEQIINCRRKLAEREIYIADVFWNMGNYGPAWKRYGYVYDNFNDIQDLSGYAKDKAQMAFLRYKEESANKTNEEIKGSWRDYFKWL